MSSISQDQPDLYALNRLVHRIIPQGTPLKPLAQKLGIRSGSLTRMLNLDKPYRQRVPQRLIKKGILERVLKRQFGPWDEATQQEFNALTANYKRVNKGKKQQFGSNLLGPVLKKIFSEDLDEGEKINMGLAAERLGISLSQLSHYVNDPKTWLPSQEIMASRKWREALQTYYPKGWAKFGDEFDTLAFAAIGPDISRGDVRAEWRKEAARVFRAVRRHKDETVGVFTKNMPEELRTASGPEESLTIYEMLERGGQAPRALYRAAAKAVVRRARLARASQRSPLGRYYQRLLSLFPELTPAGQILLAQGVKPGEHAPA